MNIAPEIGSIVADKFRIERVLAEGGMGLVVAATHIQLEQTVALKFFRGDLRSSGEPLLRFMREAKAAAQIKSEYVARVLDVGVTDDGTPYMVMEYLEGEGLEKVVARGPLPVPSAVEYAIQACEGLAEAHARGIVHRDIKPSNLFLTERSPGWRTIKILDFGISKVSLAQASNITTNLNLVMGTPCYMSPEQFQSAAGVDQRSDIWSLGSTLFEMLAGRPPFDPGLPLLALAESIVKREPPPLRELRPDVPQELVDAISRAMAKDRERRFPSAAGLAIALLPFAPGRASATAERAAAITPARGLRELDQQELHTLPPLGAAPAKENTDGKSGMWTHLGFAGPAPPPPRENAATPPPPAPSIAAPGGTSASLITGGVPVAALVPFDRAPVDEVEAPGPWQPKTSWVVITASLLVCAVAVMAFLRTTPSPRASGSPLTISQALAPVAPAPGASSSSSSELLVRVTPPTAQIMIDGAVVSGNPFRGRFPGGVHQIQAFAPGYEPKLQQASLATDVVVELSLDRRTRGAPPVTAGRATPPAAQARMPPLGQGARLQQPRPPSTPARAGGSAAGAPTTSPPAAAMPAIPGLVTPPDVVDPRGGRNPMHPIEIRSPYKNNP